jgi:hypothetical protein
MTLTSRKCRPRRNYTQGTPLHEPAGALCDRQPKLRWCHRSSLLRYLGLPSHLNHTQLSMQKTRGPIFASAAPPQLRAKAPTSSTSMSSVPEHFRPLVKVLKAQHAQGFEHPLRSKVGGELAKTSYAGKYGSFKEYAGEAENMGFVRLSTGEAIGSEWVQLRRSRLKG